MKFKAYNIIERAVEEGITMGMSRAYKHTETPGAEAIIDAVQSAVMDTLDEVIDFDTEDSTAIKDSGDRYER